MCHVGRIRSTLDSSCSREGALAEYTKELRRLGIAATADQPKDLVTLNVGVARVLDLTNARERKRFGVSLDTLAGARNLNLYVDGRADNLRLMEGSERTPLNY